MANVVIPHERMAARDQHNLSQTRTVRWRSAVVASITVARRNRFSTRTPPLLSVAILAPFAFSQLTTSPIFLVCVLVMTKLDIVLEGNWGVATFLVRPFGCLDACVLGMLHVRYRR